MTSVFFLFRDRSFFSLSPTFLVARSHCRQSELCGLHVCKTFNSWEKLQNCCTNGIFKCQKNTITDIIIIIIYTIMFLKSVCQRLQTAGRNSCSIISGNVSNCSYRLTVYHVTSSRLNSA